MSMSSIPQFYSNSTEIPSNEFYRFPTNPGGVVNADSCAIWNGEDLLNPLLYYGNGNELDHQALQSSPESDTISSSVMVAEQLVGISNSNNIMCSAFSDDQILNMSYFHGVAETNDQNIINNNYIISDGYQLQQKYVPEFGEECCGIFIPDIKPIDSIVARENLKGMQNTNQMHWIEEANAKVLRYSEEERKERIIRYLKKRNQRNFSKTIKYACRKNLADRRVRVRGRFAKNYQVCDHDQEMRDKKINVDDSSCNNIPDQTNLCCETETHAIQMKYNDEEWLQEAMASLVCMPNYVASG